MFWSTLKQVLNAIVGFVSVPLLLKYYGKADYGLIAIATACNGYMHLLDLGMNVGAVKYFSQWKAEGNIEKINRVARTNITFYAFIALINALLLLLIVYKGQYIFSVTETQFYQLKICLIIIAIFSLFSWCTTAFNQLLISYEKVTYTMQIQCITTIMKCVLIGCVFIFKLNLTSYFLLLTIIGASLIVPYAYKCKKEGMINSLCPAFYWNDFKGVLSFCLSIFALSIFQFTSTQSRPIILSIFSDYATSVVADFKIIEVIPQLIIMISGTFSTIFLPKTAEMVTKNNKSEIESFAYKWTTIVSVVANMLCIPFILCSKDILVAYVGNEYSYLSTWLIIWCSTVLLQIHTSPSNALILAYGRTKFMVYTSAVSCIVSMILNAVLCPYLNVGSAILGYLIYVIIVISSNYLYYYKKLIGLKCGKIVLCFLLPTVISVIIAILVSFVSIDITTFPNNRINLILGCCIKSALWLIPYFAIVKLAKIIDFKQIKK